MFAKVWRCRIRDIHEKFIGKVEIALLETNTNRKDFVAVSARPLCPLVGVAIALLMQTMI